MRTFMTCDLLLLLHPEKKKKPRRLREKPTRDKKQCDKQLQPHSWMGQPEVEEALQILLHPPRRTVTVTSSPSTTTTPPPGPREEKTKPHQETGTNHSSVKTQETKYFVVLLYMYVHIYTYTVHDRAETVNSYLVSHLMKTNDLIFTDFAFVRLKRVSRK